MLINVTNQTQEMIERANRGILSLKLLARHGVPPPHLLRIFLTLIRLLVEYPYPVLFYELTSDNTNTEERIMRTFFPDFNFFSKTVNHWFTVLGKK